MPLVLITDRVTADVQRVRELAEKGWLQLTPAERTLWLSGLKGAYNATDLNRVGGAIAYIAQLLSAYGYRAEVSPRTDWTMDELPSPESTGAYLDEVRKIRAALGGSVSAAQVPEDMEGLTFEEANDIERILLQIEQLIENMGHAFRHCGAPMSICGLNGGLIT